ncbi:phage gp6-like head-tail connector protein [Martelella alba]|uniref:Phage gp6-like head-tail connector protein n=1 Tax=Martelella alba TaxID=2590451 RepID=A0A506UCD8_9HYPH|nr:head-tail connector protein [Martelella alba]TPW30329.1 phage gp6-like head-tail connector protein [Martelella alba]
MSLVTLEQVKAHIAVEFDDDDTLLTGQIAAAQNLLERLLGFAIDATYGGEGQDDVPPALEQAALMLVAHWYANREATVMGETPRYVPFGVREIVNEFRNWSF